VLSWDLDLSPGETREVLLAIPFHEPYVESLAAVTSERAARATVNAEQAAVRRRWQTLLSRVEIDIPAAPELVRTAKTTLAYTLINRDGPAIQPGSRTYARSWIRDGAITSAALLQMGFPADVRDFIRWYASHQLPDGKVPCCIDRRGADSVPEHDSVGQFVWLIGEYYRYTRDVGLVADLWPNVVKAIDYMAALRATRTTDAYRMPSNAAYFGLLPESISHEGYSSHPVHAYWDQFWALAGLRVAPQLANVVGDLERYDAYTALRDGFQADLIASVPRAMAMHAIDYVPGSVELGDYDPSSTAIAVNLVADEPTLRPALDRTFTRYLEELAARRSGTNGWIAYSPYEIRNVEALTLLGRRADAHALLDWIIDDRRPPAWNEWAEISYRDATAPQFIGDMPHTWVGCIFVHALRAMLVRERDADRALVIGAGVPARWMARGVTARRLPTASGVLSFTMRADGDDAVRVRLSGDVAVPRGGIVIASPYDRPIHRATLDGRPLETVTDAAVTVDRCPADVVLHFEPVRTAAPTDAAAG
jgi:GH15 family glucan-1,4-alpha-glucosidase